MLFPAIENPPKVAFAKKTEIGYKNHRGQRQCQLIRCESQHKACREGTDAPFLSQSSAYKENHSRCVKDGRNTGGSTHHVSHNVYIQWMDCKEKRRQKRKEHALDSHQRKDQRCENKNEKSHRDMERHVGDVVAR